MGITGDGKITPLNVIQAWIHDQGFTAGHAYLAIHTGIDGDVTYDRRGDASAFGPLGPQGSPGGQGWALAQ